MNINYFTKKIAKLTLRFLLILTITAFAQKITAGPASRLSVNSPTAAQPTVTSCPLTVLPNSNTSSGNARAPSTRFAASRAVYLITPAEMAASGYQNGEVPTTLGWTYSAQAGPAGSAPLAIYLENTNDTTNTKSTTFATAISTMTQVLNATTALPGAPGSFDIALTGGSSFTYTGGGIYVAYDWGPYTGTLSTTALVLCNNSLPASLLGANSAAATLTASAFRPETRLSSTLQNETAVGFIYSLGELPLGLAPAQVMSGVIKNNGALAQTNLPVTLRVAGVDSFFDTKTLASLASCNGVGISTFAPFVPVALGTDTVTVTVPSDSVPTNDSLSKPLSITPLNYSYKYPGSTSAGGVGFTGATGALVAKFPLTAANAVTAVKIDFPAVTATTYRIAIYGDDGLGNPSTTPLYVDAADRTVTVAGPVTITLPSPVAVPAGNFYAGVQQTNTTNLGLGYDLESPIRSGAFYVGSPVPVTAFSDFSPGTDFKVNIGVVLQTAAPTATTAVSRKLHAGVPFDIPLPGIECRSGGATNDYQIVFTFASNVTFTTASVPSGMGSVASSSGSGTNTVTVNLTGVTNAQFLTVTLSSLNNGVSTGDVSTEVSVLVADTTGNGLVNSGDATQTRGRSGQPADATNFRSDVNADGFVNSGDATVVRGRSGTSLP